eukprot:scaffold1277_cov253-Pinguiococcus_pyrenoidosus.AAC.30
MQHHPDKSKVRRKRPGIQPGTDVPPTSSSVFRSSNERIPEAYEVLSDPGKKAEYDRERRRQAIFEQSGRQQRSAAGKRGRPGESVYEQTYFYDARTGRRYRMETRRDYGSSSAKPPSDALWSLSTLHNLSPLLTFAALLGVIWFMERADAPRGPTASQPRSPAPGERVPTEAAAAAARAAQERWQKDGDKWKPSPRPTARKSARPSLLPKRYEPAMLEARGLRTLVLLVTPEDEATAAEAGTKLATELRLDRITVSYDVVNGTKTGRKWAAFLRRDFSAEIRPGCDRGKGMRSPPGVDAWAVAIVLMPGGRRGHSLILDTARTGAQLATTVKHWLVNHILSGTEAAQELRTELLW